MQLNNIVKRYSSDQYGMILQQTSVEARLVVRMICMYTMR